MTQVRLDVVSDVVCPWCWLGKARLDAALKAVPELDVSVTWRPFELDPEVPREGVGYADYMAAHFGDAIERLRQGQVRLTEAGAEAGLTYRFDEIPIRPNTLDAHRLVRWARGQGRDGDAVEALFRAHFDELRDVGDAEVLADIADEVGLDRDAIVQLLATETDLAEVRAEEKFFRDLGIAGVPTIIANGRTAVQGAHETDALVRFIRGASEMKDVRQA